MFKIGFSLIYAALLMTTAITVLADEVATFNESDVPYKLIKGGQYEICNALLPVINMVTHGALRKNPALLTKVEGLELPAWKPVKDKKYIDLYIRNFKTLFLEEFSEKNYQANYVEIAKAIDKGERRFYVAQVDLENSGRPRSALRHEVIDNKKYVGGYYYFGFDEKSMTPDKLYPGGSSGEIFLFKGKTFRLIEWQDVWNHVSFWSIGVAEPYYQEGRSAKAIPSIPVKSICTFSAK